MVKRVADASLKIYSKSAARIMQILNYLATAKDPVGMSELSRDLSIPKSSIFSLIHTLAEGRYVEETENGYTLGFKLFQTGIAYLSNVQLHQIAHPLLHELMERTGETVHLAVEDEGSLVFIDSVEADHSLIRSVARLGRSDRPMYCSGLGKALLAGWPEKRLSGAFRNTAFEKITRRTIGSFDDLLKELKRTRKRGYALDNRESSEELCCVACPIGDRTSRIVAAVSCSFPYHRADEKRPSVIEAVTETALQLSQKLGFTGDRLYTAVEGRNNHVEDGV
jgi:DNA-binding IclR family transcriptional regulator